MRLVRLLYPFFFVLLPILTVLTRNPGGSTLQDVAVLLAIMVAGCAVAYGLLAVLSGRGWKSPEVALIVFAGVVWFFGYDALRTLYALARRGPAPQLVTALAIVILAAATVLGVRWLSRRPHFLDRVTTFLALTGLFLVLWSGIRIVSDQLAARSALRQSRLAEELRIALPVNSQSTQRPRRDMYLIILDEYANSSVLRKLFGFDNRQFEDSLGQLGFTIPRLIRSNYVHTLLSLPSLLNFSHLNSLGEELGYRDTDPTLPDYLVENNRTASFLKSQGYQFLFFPSQWWISTAHNRNADWEFQAWHGFNLVRDATRSDLRRAFIGTTPLALLRKNDAYDADHVERTLAAIEQVPSRDEPTFVLAHILNPHYPYVFDAGCRTLPHRPSAGWGKGRQQAYVNQVRCLNSLLLRTVTNLLKRSAQEPIILLVGDHGTNSLGYEDAVSAGAVSPAQAGERFGAFGAFFLPGGGSQILADSTTLVNVVPKVLNHYFGAGIHLNPDKLYMSLERTPYLFSEVDPASLTP
jgi:hypothetical protein